jgi:hypothetical protein
MRKFILAASIAALAVPAVAPAIASADVQRYQMETATFTVTQPQGETGQWTKVWNHAYSVTLNPCTNKFEGTGTQYSATDPFTGTETVSGTYANGKLTYTSLRNDGVSWTLANAPTDGTSVTLGAAIPAVSWPLEFTVSPLKIKDLTSVKNHGQYVSSVGGGDDAAHSCIGMPIQSS